MQGTDVRVLLAAIAAVLLNGCVLLTPARSSVTSSLTAIEAAQIARDVGEYLGSAMPPAQTVLAMERPRFARFNDDVGPVLAQVLRVSGFAVLESDSDVPGARRLSYVVSAWDDGVSVRVRLDSYSISRWYNRRSDGLVAVAPFTVKAGVGHGR